MGPLIAVGSHSHLLVLINTATGQIQSEILLSDAIEGSACHSFCKNKIIIGCNDGNIYCINIISFAVDWKFKTESAIKCTPILCRDNRCVMFGSYDKTLYCLRIQVSCFLNFFYCCYFYEILNFFQDGSLAWKNKISEIVKSKPILYAEKKIIYVTTLQGSCFGICEDTGNTVLRCNTVNPIFGSPCLYKNIIIWADVKGHVYFKRRKDFETVYYLK